MGLWLMHVDVGLSPGDEFTAGDEHGNGLTMVFSNRNQNQTLLQHT